MGSNHIGHPQIEHSSTGNLATAGESTRNQETGYENRKLKQPPVDKKSEALFNSYPSLKKAVANAHRRFDFLCSFGYNVDDTFNYKSVNYDRPGECRPEKDCLSWHLLTS